MIPYTCASHCCRVMGAKGILAASFVELAKCRPRALLLLLPSAVVRAPVRCGSSPGFMFRRAGIWCLESIPSCSLSLSLSLSPSLCFPLPSAARKWETGGCGFPNWCPVRRLKPCKFQSWFSSPSSFEAMCHLTPRHPSPINPSGQRNPQRGLPRWARKPQQGLTKVLNVRNVHT